MGKLLSFAPTEDALTAAWEAFEHARNRAAEMTAAGSTSRERMLAHLEAARLHRDFCKLGERYDATRKGA